MTSASTNIYTPVIEIPSRGIPVAPAPNNPIVLYPKTPSPLSSRATAIALPAISPLLIKITTIVLTVVIILFIVFLFFHSRVPRRAEQPRPPLPQIPQNCQTAQSHQVRNSFGEEFYTAAGRNHIEFLPEEERATLKNEADQQTSAFFTNAATLCMITLYRATDNKPNDFPDKAWTKLEGIMRTFNALTQDEQADIIKNLATFNSRTSSSESVSGSWQMTPENDTIEREMEESGPLNDAESVTSSDGDDLDTAINENPSREAAMNLLTIDLRSLGSELTQNQPFILHLRAFQNGIIENASN